MKKNTFLQIYYKMNNFSFGLLAFGIEISLILLGTSAALLAFANRFPKPVALYPMAAQMTECGITIISISVMFALIIDVAINYRK